jgi:endonuclease-3 related protein
MVGAVLTQNTAWTNVEKAINNLKTNNVLTPEKIANLHVKRLASWLKPSGYFNVKAKRLKAFCRWLLEQGGEVKLRKLTTHDLRHALLSVHGVGPETADDMLLYAFDRPVFVIDAYTRRLFQRVGLITGDEGYETLRHWFETKLDNEKQKVALFNEYHALIVRHAKEVCKTKPNCAECCLAKRCKKAGLTASGD